MESQRPTISVIVPVYNVAEYLLDCLNALATQTFKNLEVLLIDDGSTDESSALAEHFAATHAQFHYFRKKNGGAGQARNFGIEKACGEYIAFIDADDIIAPRMFEVLYAACKRDKSDMAICNARRFDGSKTWASGIHNKAIAKALSVTTIKDSPSLLYERTLTNRLIKRSFFQAHNFRYPENMYYEDVALAIKMHCLSKQTSVINMNGYYWRVRSGSAKSTTQEALTIEKLRARLAALREIDTFLVEQGYDIELLKTWHAIKLEIDLTIFLNQFPFMDNEVAQAFQIELVDYLTTSIPSSIRKNVLEKVPLICEQKIKFLLEGKIDKLRALRNYQLDHYYSAPTAVYDGRIYAKLPPELFSIPRRDITEETRQDCRSLIDSLKVTSDTIQLDGHVYIKRLSLPKGMQTVSCKLVNQTTGAYIPLTTEEINCTSLTNSQGMEYDSYGTPIRIYNYDGAGFRTAVTLTDTLLESLSAGTWLVMAHYKNPYSEGKLPLIHASARAQRAAKNAAVMAKNKHIAVTFDQFNEFSLTVSECLYSLDQAYIPSQQASLPSKNLRFTLTCHKDHTTPSGNISAAPIKAASEGDEYTRDRVVALNHTLTNDDASYELDCDCLPLGVLLQLFIDNNDQQQPLFCATGRNSIMPISDGVVILQTARTLRASIEKRPSAALLQKVHTFIDELILEVSCFGIASYEDSRDCICITAYTTEKESVEVATSTSNEYQGDPIAQEYILASATTIQHSKACVTATFSLAAEKLAMCLSTGTWMLSVAVISSSEEQIRIPLYACKHMRHLIKDVRFSATMQRGDGGSVVMAVKNKALDNNNTEGNAASDTKNNAGHTTTDGIVNNAIDTAAGGTGDGFAGNTGNETHCSKENIFLSCTAEDSWVTLNLDYYQDFFRRRGYSIIQIDCLPQDVQRKAIEQARNIVSPTGYCESLLGEAQNASILILDSAHDCSLQAQRTTDGRGNCITRIVATRNIFPTTENPRVQLYAPTSQFVEYLDSENLPYTVEELNPGRPINTLIYLYLQAWTENDNQGQDEHFDGKDISHALTSAIVAYRELDKKFAEQERMTKESIHEREHIAAEKRLQQATAQIKELQQELNTITSSRSWKLTAPLRRGRNNKD